MSFASEFKEFAMKGNVVDLAVGVIIGGAFGKIVDSIVGDLIMPIIGAVFGKVDFSNLFIELGKAPDGVPHTLDALRKAGVPVFAYGNFITILINFIILAFIIFLMPCLLYCTISLDHANLKLLYNSNHMVPLQLPHPAQKL